MHVIETIRRFNTKNFSVVVEALEETDLDLSWDDKGDVAKKLRRGELVAFCARVRVLLHGQEIGVNYLGGCIYESYSAFMDHKECGKQNREYEKQGSYVRCGSYFSGMISETIGEARATLIQSREVKVRGLDK
jgi:hypothetical protein